MPDRAAGVNQGAEEGAMTSTHDVSLMLGKAAGDSSPLRPVVEPVTGTCATVAAQIAILCQCNAIYIYIYAQIAILCQCNAILYALITIYCMSLPLT